MQFEALLENFNSDLWGHHLLVPDMVSQHFLESTGKRVVCTLNGHHSFHCALMPIRGGGHFININKVARTKLNLAVGDRVRVELAPDTTPYGMPMSEELEEVLRQDALASEYFHSLTAGKQRSLIYYAGNVKSASIRLRRALVVAEHLVIHEGKADFKILNQEMKAANNRGSLW